MLNMMTEMGYDAGTIGNHEFDNGLEGLRDPLPHAGFPLINSNYDFSDTILSGKFPRYKIFKKSGLRIGIYGLGIQLRGLVNEKQHGAVRYNDPIPVALEMEKFLALEKKCDLVVCLSHLGLRYQNDKISDVSLAPELSYTDGDNRGPHPQFSGGTFANQEQGRRNDHRESGPLWWTHGRQAGFCIS